VELPGEGDSIVPDERAKQALVAAMLMPPPARAQQPPAFGDLATKSERAEPPSF
jgi:hypothetical protein